MTGSQAPIVEKGWSIYAHPVFLDQLEGLIKEVEDRKFRDPETYKKKNCSKRLAAVFKVMTEVIPNNPADPEFRQGDTLGDNNKHWFRAKFLQQYRLFFRFDRSTQIIVLAWVNDEKTLRSYGRKTDAYATFKGMLDDGNPPDDFNKLLEQAKKASPRLKRALVTK